MKIGIIGTGNFYKYAHAKAREALSNAVVVVVCDIDERAAREAAELHSAPKVYTDYHDMLASEQLDAIDICTSNVYHSEIAITVLEAGLHVFCEKPDAMNFVELRGTKGFWCKKFIHDNIVLVKHME